MWVSKSTGASVVACARPNRHLIALEHDEEILDGVLSTYKDAPPIEEEIGESVPAGGYKSDGRPVKKPRMYIGAFYLYL